MPILAQTDAAGAAGGSRSGRARGAVGAESSSLPTAAAGAAQQWPPTTDPEGAAFGSASAAAHPPAVPEAFRRAPFHPARQALAVLALPEEEQRRTAVAHLTLLRSELVAQVAAAAPPWEDHVELAARLNDALQVSHHASGVAAQMGGPLSSLMRQDAAASGHGGGTGGGGGEANVSGDREDREGLAAGPVGTAGPYMPGFTFSAKNMKDTLERIETVDAKLKLLAEVRELAVLADVSEKAEDRTERISLVGKALKAAETPPLSQIDGLAPVRTSLSERAADLEVELFAEIADGIFCAFENDVTRSSSATPLQKSPHEDEDETVPTAYERACKAVLQLNILRGPKAAARAIDEAAEDRIDAVMQSVLELASSPAARSAYSAANRQADFDGDRTRRSELGASGRAGRPVCTKVLRELEECVRGIMDRLVRLSIDVPEMKGQQNAISAVWRVVEQRVAALARYFLDFDDSEHRLFTRTAPSPSSDMLPSIQLVGGYEDDARGAARVPYQWHGRVIALPDVRPDIYNLAAIHGCILRIASHGADAVTGLTERDDLIVLLEDAGKALVDTVRRDVKRAAAVVLELRATALLQAATFRDRVTISQHHGVHHPKLPLLPSVRDLAPIVADVLSLAPLVPTVAADLGAVLGEHIFAPFANRCVAALNLVSTWSDAGHVYDRVVVDNPSMTPRDVVNRACGNEHRCATLDAVVALYGDTTGIMPPEPTLFDEDQWKAMVQLVASVSALVYEVRLVAGEEMTGLAADVIPLVRFRPRLKGSHGASSAGTPLSASSMSSSAAARATDAFLDSSVSGVGYFQTQRTAMPSSETTRSAGAAASERTLGARSGPAQQAHEVSGRVSAAARSAGTAEILKGQRPGAAAERSRIAESAGVGGPRYGCGQHVQGGWGFSSGAPSAPLHTSGLAAMHSGDAMRAMARVVSAAQESLLALEVGVVDRSLVLLQADVLTRCYSRAFRALRAVSTVFASGGESGEGGRGSEADGPDLSQDGASTIQQFEYDEFGDLIEGGSGDLTAARAAERSEPSSASNSSQHSAGGSSGTISEALRGVEVESLAGGLNLGSDLRWAHSWAKVSLGAARRRFVFKAADAAITAGLRAGYSSSGRDRALSATAARAFARGVRAEGAGALRSSSRRSSPGNGRGSDAPFRSSGPVDT